MEFVAIHIGLPLGQLIPIVKNMIPGPGMMGLVVWGEGRIRREAS